MPILKKSRKLTVFFTAANWESQVDVDENAMANAFFKDRCYTIGIRESWYFGVTYKDVDGNERWLDLRKKRINFKKIEQPPRFRLSCRFYPENVEEILQNPTIDVFYHEAKKGIVSGGVYCPPETAVLLAALQAQARYGPYNPTNHKVGSLNIPAYICSSVREQFDLTDEAWEEKIITWWKHYKDTDMEEAKLEYLKLAQDLEMYGVTYFPIKKNTTELWLGVDSLGLTIYEKDNKLTPKLSFSWNEIQRIKCSNNKVSIVTSDPSSSSVVFHADSKHNAKEILTLAGGNHELYIRRRGPDSVEVQQMKLEAVEAKKQRQMQREKFAEERKNREYWENRCSQMTQAMSEKETELRNSELTRTEYEHKLAHMQSELERERAALNALRERLEDINRQSEMSNAMTAEELNRLMAEREHLLEQIAQQQQVIVDKQASADAAGDAAEEEEEPSKSPKSDTKEIVLASANGLSGDNLDVLASAALTQDVKLKGIRDDLSNLRKEECMQDADRQYIQSLKKGMNKYRTLAAIRKGNTKKRVEEFESM